MGSSIGTLTSDQGHSRIPGNVAEEALGERLTAERCRQLGQIFHASRNSNSQRVQVLIWALLGLNCPRAHIVLFTHLGFLV